MKRTITGAVLAGLLAFLALAQPAAQQGIPQRYTACSPALALATPGDMLNIESGSDRGLLIQRIWVIPGTQTTAGYHQILVRYTNSASTGGATQVATPTDLHFLPFSGIVRNGATGGGNALGTLFTGAFFAPTTTTPGGSQDYVIYDATGAVNGAIAVAKGVANGIKITDSTGGAGGANHYACILFTEAVQ